MPWRREPVLVSSDKRSAFRSIPSPFASRNFETSAVPDGQSASRARYSVFHAQPLLSPLIRDVRALALFNSIPTIQLGLTRALVQPYTMPSGSPRDTHIDHEEHLVCLCRPANRLTVIPIVLARRCRFYQHLGSSVTSIISIGTRTSLRRHPFDRYFLADTYAESSTYRCVRIIHRIR